MATSRSNPIPPPISLPAANFASHAVPPTPSPSRPTIPSYQSLDPLLANLSPESTLEALTSTDAVPKNEPAYDILCKSISQVSEAERALGIRAAVAAQNLSLWYKEVQTWEWPKCTDAQLGQGFISPSTTISNTSEPEYLGSLPAGVVAEHEKRIEEIRDGMESLGVDELKEHVLNAHIPSRSRPSSSNSNLSGPPSFSYVQLSDFTAVITATILRALPLLSRLNSLLSTWDVRLLVLRQVPGLLWSLRLAQSELNSALDLLKPSTPPSEQDALYSRTNYHAKRAALEVTVLSAGRRMDRMLDALEGREDSLPENWIDELEAIESGFGNWVMDAEKQTVENEWRRMMANKLKSKDHPQVPNQPAPVSDENGAPEDLTTQPPEPFPQAARPPLMETIAEEPGSPTEDQISFETMLDQSVATSQRIEQAPTRGSGTSSSLDGTETANDSSEASRTIQEADTVIEPIVTPERSTTNTAVLDALPLGEKETANAHPVHAQQISSESVCTVAAKDMPFSDLNREEVTLPEDILPRKTEPVCELQKAAEDPFVAQDKVLGSAEQRSQARDYPGNSASPEADSSPASPSSQAETGSVIIQRPKGVVDSPTLEETVESHGSETSTVPTAPESIIEVFGQLRSASAEEATTPPSVTVEPAPTDVAASIAVNRDSSLSSRTSSPSSPVSSRPPPSLTNDKDTAAPSPRQPLDSPIKLSKTRPGRLDPEETLISRGRRASGASVDSSDYPSLVSSPDIRGLHTVSSNGTPKLIETPPLFQTDYQRPGPMPTNSDHTLREDRLLRLDSEKSPPTSLKHNRALSLPLQRFINERLDMDYEGESNTDLTIPTIDKKVTDSVVRSSSHNDRLRPLSHSSKQRHPAPSTGIRRPVGRRSDLSREDHTSSGPDSVTQRQPKVWERNKNTSVRNTAHKAPVSQPPVLSTATRARKQLTAHPSLESIGAYKSTPRRSGETLTGTANEKTGSRPSTPGSQIRRPRDHLDEKISSILTTLPTRIHFEDREADASSVISSLPLNARERFRSISPQGSASRSGTPTPSLTLTPAGSRRRYSHAPEESSVKLYHLHQGGKTVPTKLFVRSVGENGERVMVRVGGGWADLAEYLREYAIHHGRRHVSDTPRVEVQGLSSRETTPTYTPPGSRLTRSGNGRCTPSRPHSVISNRPSSSLAVRKTRRASNVSDMTDLRAASTIETLNLSSSPMSTVSSRRRLSTSSNTSFGAASTMSDARYGSIPLGLAGPKPRSRYAPMSAESEAWVEDVLGQARRSSSLRPFTFGLSPPEQDHAAGKVPTLPKSRSISDIGKVGSSKRVVLRGLGSR
ncbi:hypothetical protein AFCA_005193 [Aspergillus flavus]|uniref:DNA, SC111 n=3 Tax=Aspergillus subgen. Circumdati TaxID=2720871 RepID=Q2U967_ASPOR|nr:unnamed protein product [Aspergillus oryzae RIB40]KAJ1712086.1 hypothetical protein NYO67_5756 [Aspergillus flavus]GMG36787.1 unnamed protein product [Aspergillus oryzae]RMZ40708.1 hypothetical protein CA14_000999 [Aspergillus flavus]UDD57696.1 hypothetical protein AFCA_005193 [Aspergillus flavus]BAE61898.1 unnamed protein product [Aspergillus oryzae RIB40]